MPRPTRNRLAALVLALAPTAAVASTHYETETVLPNLAVLTQGDVFHLQPRGNVSIIEQAHGIVLVDSGGSPAAAEEVIAAIRARGLKPVTAIVLTHWHGDHVLGVRRLLQEWPSARVISTRPTRDHLESPATDRFMPGDDDSAREAFLKSLHGGVEFLRRAASDDSMSLAEREGFAVAASEYEAFAGEMTLARRPVSTEVFDGQLQLPDPSTPVDILFLARANTDGDAIVRLPRQGVVITGDVVVAPVPFGGDTYPREWLSVLKTLERWRPRILVPGHGRVQHNLAYVDALAAAIEDVLTRIGPLARSRADAAKPPKLEPGPFEARVAGNDAWLRRWYRTYWHDPLVASALREAPPG
jgi:glyoxylase-like metal-dependent hydrolase (beta-lactamase superfamily II)